MSSDIQQTFLRSAEPVTGMCCFNTNRWHTFLFTMMVSSKPIPIGRPARQDFSSLSSHDSLSRSLGDFRGHSLLQRHVSDNFGKPFAGYLLKRSVSPHTLVSPFPVPSEDESEHLVPPPLTLKPSTEQLHVEDYSDSSQSIQSSNLPQHLLLETEELVRKPNPIQVCVEAACAFFGLARVDRVEKLEERPVEKEQTVVPQQLRTKSAPIKVKSVSMQEFKVDEDPFRAGRMSPMRSISMCSQPSDFHDKDGHLWHSRYCILEDGILYFYRHQEDAESFEAQHERQRGGDFVGRVAIADSPTPTKYLIEYGNRMWEKRVALADVGAVRSAELEYGLNSFELSASNEEDMEKLVLRARTAEEMNEWLFQFHMALRAYVMNIMDQVAPSSNVGDIHHPRFAYQSSHDTNSPVRSSALSTAFSPRFQHIIGVATPPLSHGHGRNSRHRRRVGLPAMAASYSESSRAGFSFAGARTPPLAQPRRLVTPQQGLRSNEIDRERETSPELSAPTSQFPEMERPIPSKKYIPPHQRNPQADGGSKGKYIPPQKRGKYVPPHLRNADSKPATRRQEGSAALTLSERADLAEEELSPSTASRSSQDDDYESDTTQTDAITGLTLGGCADPRDVQGSILDQTFKAGKASKIGKVQSKPHGHRSNLESPSKLQWEIGAVSECGIRESNEDSYLVTSDLLQAFGVDAAGVASLWGEGSDSHKSGLFAVFDGHCGNEASRYAAERITQFLGSESHHEDQFLGSESQHEEDDVGKKNIPQRVEKVMRRAISSLDDEFCNICVEGGRSWESGTTALIAALVDQHLVIASLGDSRGVLSRSVRTSEEASVLEDEGWQELPLDESNSSMRCLWKEVSQAHSPNREDELERIMQANGWVVTEKEIPVSQLRRMDWFDEDVYDIVKRCFADRYQMSPRAAAPQRILRISRICGELSVSRAIGDRDFKASYNHSTENGHWDSPLFFCFPESHDRTFRGDLISSEPDFSTMRVGCPGVFDEFLLLACDGLWDVMDPDDAVRITRNLLFEKGWPAKKAAARLAELAIHLGSSDNVTVIVVRFFDR